MTEPTRAVSLIEATPELNEVARKGQWLAALEGHSPTGREAQAAAYRIAAARDLGFPDLAAAELFVVNGRLGLSTKLLRAIAEQDGYLVRKVEDEPTHVTAAVIRAETGEEVGRATFRYEEATAAGLVRNGSAWATYPGRMLWARAAKRALDDFAPRVTLGFRADEPETAEVEGSPSESHGSAEPSPSVAAEAVEEAEFREVEPEPAAEHSQEAIARERNRHWAIVNRLDNEGMIGEGRARPLPAGYAHWGEVSLALAKQSLGVEVSRSELDADGWSRLTALVEAEAIPFG